VIACAEAELVPVGIACGPSRAGEIAVGRMLSAVRVVATGKQTTTVSSARKMKHGEVSWDSAVGRRRTDDSGSEN